MDRFKHVIPDITYKRQAIDFIQGFEPTIPYINGTSSLIKYVDDYEGWLDKIEYDKKRPFSEEKVPGEVYFLVREIDNRIIGMIKIRPRLNEDLKKFGGNIGYSVRPSERKKGYNKINLYLGLKRCKELGIKDVILDCSKDNVASSKTIKALDGELIKEEYNDEHDIIVQHYRIDVDKSIEKNKEKYEDFIY